MSADGNRLKLESFADLSYPLFRQGVDQCVEALLIRMKLLTDYDHLGSCCSDLATAVLISKLDQLL